MPHIILEFSSAATVERNVAGVPAGARAVHALAALTRGDAVDRCTLISGRDWMPSGHLLAECARLAPDVQVSASPPPGTADEVVIQGETFVAALARTHGRWNRDAVLLALADARIRRPGADHLPSVAASLRLLDRAGRQILEATGKAGDGIVSRHLNRPISRAISRQLLRFPGLKPSHASFGTALLGVAMTLALVVGGQAGLIAGALLFQAASIFDGVDGEMARATCRTSKAGASLDSVIDACTNLAFIMGVAVNVWLSGDLLGAAAGGTALLTLAVGLTLMARRSRDAGEAVNFEMVKMRLRKEGARSILTEWLIHMTMRDFYAAASAVMILAGLTHFLLLAFATVTAGWFCVTVSALARGANRVRRADGAARRSRASDNGSDSTYLEGGAMLSLAPKSRTA